MAKIERLTSRDLSRMVELAQKSSDQELGKLVIQLVNQINSDELNDWIS